MQTAESNCLFTFELGEKLYIERGCLSDLSDIDILLLFVAESDRVCFGRERPTDANEQTAWREHGTLNSRSIGRFSHLVLLFFNGTITRKCITVVVCDF